MSSVAARIALWAFCLMICIQVFVLLAATPITEFSDPFAATLATLTAMAGILMALAKLGEAWVAKVREK